MLTQRFGRALRVFLAAVFLLPCLAVTADPAMAEGQECQATHATVRSGQPTASHDIAPAVPGAAPALVPRPAPTRWPTPNLPPASPPQHEVAPSAPRSPPLRAA